MKIRWIGAHRDNFASPRTSAIDRIVIHYTAGNGDTAQNNGQYFAKADRGASAHYFVDAKEIVQTVKEGDRAFHAGDRAMNDRSIGIEMCSRRDAKGMYYIPNATVTLTVQLVKELMKKYGIPISGVIRHFDVNGKVCPEPFVRNPNDWADFRAKLQPTPREIVQNKAGLADSTMEYLERYKYGAELIQKLAKAMQ